MKLKNWISDDAQKLKLWQNSKAQIVTILKLWQNSNCDKTHIVTSQKPNFDKTQKPKLWQILKYDKCKFIKKKQLKRAF